MADLISLPHYQQSAEGYCLSACARMMLAYLGVEMTEVEVSRVLGAQEFGAPSFAVQRLAALNLKVAYREWSISQLLEALEAKTPVLVFVRTAFLDHWTRDVAHAQHSGKETLAHRLYQRAHQVQPCCHPLRYLSVSSMPVLYTPETRQRASGPMSPDESA